MIRRLQKRYPRVYNSASDAVGQLADLELSSIPITSKVRKLKAHWTVDNEPTSMKQVRVEKAKLLAILRKNRSEHREIFIQAQKTFRVVAIKALDEQLKAARKGRPFVLSRLTALEAPQDHTENYDRSIQMLEMSVDEHILIDEREFQNYVQDKWQWSREWASNNMRYTSKSSRHYGKLSSLSSDS